MSKKDWDNLYRDKGEIQTEVIDLVKNSVKLLKEKGIIKILDLDFGTGRHSIFLAEKGFDVYGIDISEKGKEITEKKIRERNLKNVHLKIADMHDIPFEDNFFDAVIAVYALEHNTIKGLKDTISEVERVMGNKGALLATLISTKDPRYGTGKEIEPNTFINQADPTEIDVPHHFSDKKEVKELFNHFHVIKLEEKTGYSKRRKAEAVHWEIVAERL